MKLFHFSIYRLEEIFKLASIIGKVALKKPLLTMRKLVVFDFDHTVVDQNTDIVIRDLIDLTAIPDEIKQLSKGSWVQYMGSIFKLLHENQITASTIKTGIENIPEVLGMKLCIETLFNRDYDVIIISDSNSEFISHWNHKNGIEPYVKYVFTNPSSFNEDGLLVIFPFHHQTTCNLSSVNICKGQVLEDFYNKQKLENNVTYSQTFYVGDGKNDICPMLRLNKNSYACARKNYYCAQNIANYIAKATKFEANIFEWTNGEDLLQFILEH